MARPGLRPGSVLADGHTWASKLTPEVLEVREEVKEIKARNSISNSRKKAEFFRLGLVP